MNTSESDNESTDTLRQAFTRFPAALGAFEAVDLKRHVRKVSFDGKQIHFKRSTCVTQHLFLFVFDT
jgi:hypothetical protein